MRNFPFLSTRGSSAKDEDVGAVFIAVILMIIVGILLILSPAMGVIYLFNLQEYGKNTFETALNGLEWWISSVVFWVVLASYFLFKGSNSDTSIETSKDNNEFEE